LPPTTALREAVVRYQPQRRICPPNGFAVGARIRSNPDFIAMEPESLRELERQHLVRMEGHAHWQRLCRVANIFPRWPVGRHRNPLRGRGGPAARGCRVVAVAVKYFNTICAGRSTATMFRACYNIFNQYRCWLNFCSPRLDHLGAEMRTTLLLRPGRPRRGMDSSPRLRPTILGRCASTLFELAPRRMNHAGDSSWR